MNNANNNNIIIKAISINFQYTNSIFYKPHEYWLYCLGYIINLSIQVFLFRQHLDINKFNNSKASKKNNQDFQEYCKLNP